MRKAKMLAVLLAGLMVVSFAGCSAKKTTFGSESETDSRITETATETDPKSTAESRPPVTESTAGKGTAENSAPTETDTKAETKQPTERTAQTTALTEPPKVTEVPPTAAPPVSRPTETTAPAKPTTPPTEQPKETETSFNIDYWIGYAKDYAESVGLKLNPEAIYCWDNPISAGPKCKYIDRDIQARMNRYKNAEDFTDVWVWAEAEGNGDYLLYVGYA